MTLIDTSPRQASPPDSPSPRPRITIGVIATIALVAVFVASYALGRGSDTGLPGSSRTGATTSTAGAVPNTGATNSTVSIPTDQFGNVEFFSNTKSALTANGCTADVTFTWTFDPAAKPPVGSTAQIAVNGPSRSDMHDATTTDEGLTLTVQIPLDTAGTWSALVILIGAQTAAPQPIWVEVAGNC